MHNISQGVMPVNFSQSRDGIPGHTGVTRAVSICLAWKSSSTISAITVNKH